MSDGNFNKALLPHTPYQSGLATGRMQMRAKAELVLKDIIKTYLPNISKEEEQAINQKFKEGTRF
ncbi:MAG: hypothetical protein IKT87_05720 [Bacteroidaceae bacterium]|nr:hypothetical protein [Bacteroidaceae bacterium]